MNAAAMAFFAMLSLVPFLIVAAGMAEMFTNIPRVTPSSDLPSFVPASGVMGYFVPFVSSGLVTQVGALVTDYDFTGVFGVVSLIFSAGLFFSATERSMRQVFGRRATQVGKLARVFGLLIGVIVLFVVLAWIMSRMGKVRTGWLAPVVSFLVIVGGFTIGVIAFGSRALRKRHVAIGAIVFYGLWLAAIQLFRLYLDIVPDFEILYGSLASIVVVVLWIFYASLVFLLSCSLIQTLRERDGTRTG